MIYVDARLSVTVPDIMRVLIVNAHSEAPKVIRVYIREATFYGRKRLNRDELLSIVRSFEGDVPAAAQTPPDIPASTPVDVFEKTAGRKLRGWVAEGSDTETHFEDMERSIEREMVERAVRRARNRQARPHQGTLKRLLKRDGPECCWCGRVTNPTLPANHPHRSTIEHVIPVSQGGRGHPGNFRVACRQCNAVRGNLPAHPKYDLRPRLEPS